MVVIVDVVMVVVVVDVVMVVVVVDVVMFVLLWLWGTPLLLVSL